MKIMKMILAVAGLNALGISACPMDVHNDTNQTVTISNLNNGFSNSVTLAPGQKDSFGNHKQHLYFAVSCNGVKKCSIKQNACSKDPLSFKVSQFLNQSKVNDLFAPTVFYH